MARPAVLALALTNIFKTHHLLTVSQLLELVEQQTGVGYNKTSVYRALEKLVEQGTLCKHAFSADEATYELRHHHHDHLVCNQCGVIQSADCQLTIPSSIEDFQVDHHHLTMFGLCSACQKSETK
jgi:Fe2+ or Zn2+ uptake regulation protein